MALPTIVIAQVDHAIAERLANELELHVHFVRVALADSALELRTLLMHRETRVAVLDLEMVTLEEVRQLARTFDALAIICTHRSPDERMWMDALDAGAVEFCHSQDTRSILRASRMAATRNLACA